MDKHLEKALHQMSTPGTGEKAYEFQYLANPDGSIRWIWPAKAGKAYFLKFYHISGFKSKVFARVSRVLFNWGLSSLVFKRLTWKTDRSFHIPGAQGPEWALFTGTPGPNRKAVFYAPNNGFMKLGLGERADEQIINEAFMLAQLRELKLPSIELPDLTFSQTEQVMLSDVSLGGVQSGTYSQAHYNALHDLYLSSVHAVLPAIDANWEKMGKEIYDLQASSYRLPKAMLSKLVNVYELLKEQHNFLQCVAHGDFTPWNMVVKGDRSALYDWEHCQYAGIGFDYFHFHFQKGILIERKSFSAIYSDIQKGFMANEIPGLPALSGEKCLEKYLAYYLLKNTSYYLRVYEDQQHWHTQIHWLLAAWNEALSFVLRHQVENRKLLINDLSDFLHFAPYAVLKCNLFRLDLLPENSDLDILLEAKKSAALTQYLRQHPLCRKIRVESKSYMTQLSLITADGGLLHLDLIHDFKRKSLRFLEAEDALKQAHFNDRNYKVLPPALDARYVSLFYALNRAEVPAKFHAYEWVLSQSAFNIDTLLADYIRGGSSRKSILKNLNALPGNRGIARLKSLVLYALDTLLNFNFKRGIIITFSGVDGAGKSTIIQEIQPKIEKVLRRRVLVLRHRPSLLPILSAWRYGKVEAEKRSVASLPRTGQNQSKIGSLIRFAYYYVDYLFGQVYIHLRYAFTGYVVIYDRYYFDFIIDGLRSNIQLPKWLSLGLYRFIAKPQLNFFLYARPEEILARKQELDRPAIEHLTAEYLALFKQLQSKSRVDYIPLLNEDKDQSLFQIFNQIKAKTA